MSDREPNQRDTSRDDQPGEDILTGEDVVLEETSFAEPEYTSDFTDSSDEALGNTARGEVLSFAEQSQEDLEVDSNTSGGDTAHYRDDIREEPHDVLGNRVDSTLGEDGESLVAVESDTDTAASVGETAVLRRSLIETPTVAPARQPEEPAPVDENETLLDGATVLPTVPSRAPARWLSAIGTLLLVPLAWYVLSDSGARLMLADNNPWATGTVNPAAIAELIGGIALLVLIAILAAQSAIGLLISGIIVTLFGLPFVFIPGYSKDLLGTYITEPLQSWNSFGGNVAYHLEFTGSTGILFMVGIAMIASAWVVYYVRRNGRAEEALRHEVATSNPDGLHARWARKASEDR